MTETRQPLIVKRPLGGSLTVAKTGDRYDSVTGQGTLTPDELAQVVTYIGDDADGQGTLDKLRAKFG